MGAPLGRQFTVAADGDLVVPPAAGGPRQVLLDGVDDYTGAPIHAVGFIDEEQWWWERYDLRAMNDQLREDHDLERGRCSEERRALHTDFANLPILGEDGSRGAVAARYVEWCNRWGSPGLIAFLYAPAGVHDGQRYIREKRTGRLLSDDEFDAEHPGLDLGDSRHREPVRIDDFSREVDLLRQVLILCEPRPTAEESARARAKLLEHMPYARVTVTESWEDEAGRKVRTDVLDGRIRLLNEDGQEVGRGAFRPRTRTVLHDSDGLFRGLPSHRDGVYPPPEDDVLAAWLWLHADARLAVTFDAKSKRRDAVWAFGSFMDALYHLLLEDITGGVLIRRCANDKCRRFFRPKRDGVYHDGRCRDRVDKMNQRQRKGAKP